jgi:hypothetical protein
MCDQTNVRGATRRLHVHYQGIEILMLIRENQRKIKDLILYFT